MVPHEARYTRYTRHGPSAEVARGVIQDGQDDDVLNVRVPARAGRRTAKRALGGGGFLVTVPSGGRPPRRVVFGPVVSAKVARESEGSWR